MHSVSSASSNSDAVVVKQFYSPFYQTEACVSLVKTSSMDTYICERFLHVYVKWHSRVRKNIDRLDAFSFISSICIFICLFVFVLYFCRCDPSKFVWYIFFNLTELLFKQYMIMYYDIIRIEQHAVCLLKPSPQTKQEMTKTKITY